MKRLLLTLLLLCGLRAGAQNPAATAIQVQVHGVTSGGVSNRTVVLTLTKPTGPVVAGPWVIAGDSVATTSDTSGNAYFSNVVMLGEYRLDIAGNPPRTFPLSVGVTNLGLVSFVSLLGTNNSVPLFYDVSQVNALLALVGGQATNLSPWNTNIDAFQHSLTNSALVQSALFAGNGGGLTNIPGAGISNAPWLLPNGNGGGLTNLNPNAVTNAPWLLASQANASATNAINATNLWGLISATNLPTGLTNGFALTNDPRALYHTNVGNLFIGVVAGNGAGLSNVPASGFTGSVTNAQNAVNATNYFGLLSNTNIPSSATNQFALTNEARAVTHTNAGSAFGGNGGALTSLNGGAVTGAVPVATGAVNATNLWAVLSVTNIPASATNQATLTNETRALTHTNAANVFAGAFFGNGAGLTNVPGVGTATNALNATNFWGLLSLTNLPATATNQLALTNDVRVVKLTNTANVFAGMVGGDGSGLSNLTASALNVGSAVNATNLWSIVSNTNIPATVTNQLVLTNDSRVVKLTNAGSVFAGNGGGLTNINQNAITNPPWAPTNNPVVYNLTNSGTLVSTSGVAGPLKSVGGTTVVDPALGFIYDIAFNKAVDFFNRQLISSGGATSAQWVTTGLILPPNTTIAGDGGALTNLNVAALTNNVRFATNSVNSTNFWGQLSATNIPTGVTNSFALTNDSRALNLSSSGNLLSGTLSGAMDAVAQARTTNSALGYYWDAKTPAPGGLLTLSYTTNAQPQWVLSTNSGGVITVSNIVVTLSNVAGLFVGNGSGLTNVNLGTATGAVASATKANFVVDASTNPIPVAMVTNAGTAAYSNTAAFYLGSNPSNYISATSGQYVTNGYTPALTINGPLSQIGNVTLFGNLNAVGGGQLLDGSGFSAINFSANPGRYLFDSLARRSVEWDNRVLKDSSQNVSFDWGARQLKATNGTIVLDWSGPSAVWSGSSLTLTGPLTAASFTATNTGTGFTGNGAGLTNVGGGSGVFAGTFSGTSSGTFVGDLSSSTNAADTARYKFLQVVAKAAGIVGYPSFYFKSSADGTNFFVISQNENSGFYDTNANAQCYTPGVTFWSNYWWVVYDVNAVSGATNLIGVAKSPDLANWTNVGNIHLTLNPGANIPGARFFTDADGSLYLTPGGWITYPLNSSMTSWAPLVRIATGGDYDATMTRAGNTYHLFTTDGTFIRHYTNTVPTNLFTLVQSDIFNGGWPLALEGPCVVQDFPGHWLMYAIGDQGFISQKYVSGSLDLTNWTLPVPITENGTIADNGSVMLVAPALRTAPKQVDLARFRTDEQRVSFKNSAGGIVFGPTNTVGVSVVARVVCDVVAHNSDTGDSAEWEIVNEVPDSTTAGTIGKGLIVSSHVPTTAYNVYFTNWTSGTKLGYAVACVGPSGNITWHVKQTQESVATDPSFTVSISGTYTALGQVYTGNGSGLTNIPPTGLRAFQLVQTNFVSGLVYTNFYGVPVHVSANAVLTTTGVAGDATLQLRVTGNNGVTNQFGVQTTGASLGLTNISYLAALVDTNGTYTFTNTSTGSGDSATVSGGQILAY